VTARATTPGPPDGAAPNESADAAPPGLVGGRPIGRVLGALGQARHYRALGNMARRYPRPVEAFARYVFGRGAYPARVEVRTPSGRVRPCLYSHHDMLTLNEVFCRLDYELAGPARVVVDVGSNIGLSALYFLTRPSRPFCFLYEPDPRNAARLRDNLGDHADRWTLAEAAVAARSGRVRFATEPTGRYGRVGGVGVAASLTVDCVGINEVLEGALTRAGTIDLVKIDTEGLELDTVRAMDPALLRRVRAIVLEAEPHESLHPALFAQRQYGSVCRLTRRAR
jgi:FkbM family methyltransferase